MSGLLVELSDAICYALNSHEFGVEFCATRSYADWELKLENETDLLVDVVPAKREKRLDESDRESRVHYCQVHIGVRKKFAREVQVASTGRIIADQIDALVTLVEDMESLLDQPCVPLVKMPAAAVMSVVTLGDYDAELLRHNRQFLSIIEATYRHEKLIGA